MFLCKKCHGKCPCIALATSWGACETCRHVTECTDCHWTPDAKPFDTNPTGKMKWEITLTRDDGLTFRVAEVVDLEVGHVMGKAIVEYYKRWPKNTFTYEIKVLP